MAFFMKFSRVASKLSKFYLGNKVFNLENKVFRLEKILSFNSLTVQEFCSKTNIAVTPETTYKSKILDSDELKKSLINLEENLNSKHFVNVKLFKQILQSINDKDDITTHEANLLIRCCGNFAVILSSEERTELAHKVVSVLEEAGVKLNIIHYNTLLTVYLQNNHKLSPYKFLKTLEEKAISPNHITFHRLLKICCYHGNINAASEILEIMKKKDMPINEDIFNSLIYGHGQVRDMQSSAEILSIMEKKGLQPNAETYSNLMCGYATAGNITKIESILKNCEEKEIMISDEELLHIAYVLVLNKHESYLGNILSKLRTAYGYNIIARNYILKLFESNCDSAAFKIFDTLHAIQSSKSAHGKFILNYFTSYRSATDILNVCRILQSRECEYNPLSYAVETIFRNENFSLALTILKMMKKERIGLFSNYFYPALINASKISNEAFLDILRQMKELRVEINFFTVERIICRNYVFGEDLLADLEILHSVGVRADYTSRALLLESLKNDQIDKFDNALKIARSTPIFLTRNKEKDYIINKLAAVNNIDLFVDILHSLMHDFYNQDGSLKSQYFKSELETDLENLDELPQDIIENRINPQTCAGITLQKWIITNNPEEVSLIKVLENMLQVGIGISLDAANFVQQKYNRDKIDTLLNKLTADNLKIQLNDEILKAKNKYPFLNNEAIEKENSPLLDCIKQIRKLAEQSEIKKAMELVDNLKNFSDGIPEEKIFLMKTYKSFLSILGHSTNFEAVRKAYDVGVEMNIINASHFFPMVSSLLKRNEIEKALDMYCIKAKETNSLPLWEILGNRIIEIENSTLLQKFLNIVTELKDEEYAISILVYLFAKSNREKEIGKLLVSPNFSMSRKTSNLICFFLSQKESEEGFQCYLKATSGMASIFREPIYKKLAMLYVKNQNLPKIKELLLKMEEENVDPSLEFIEIVSDLYSSKGEISPFGENVALAEVLK